MREHLRFGRHPQWIVGLAGAFIVAGTASVVAVAASSPVVEVRSPNPASSPLRDSPTFPGTFVSSTDAQPDCHLAPHDYLAAEDTPLAQAIVCSDQDGTTLTYAVTAAAAHGVVTIAPAGQFTYVPSPNYNGPDSFQFQAQDPGGAVDAGTATVAVSAVNDPPVATPDSASMAEDGGSVTTLDVLANDTPGGGPDETGQKLAISGFTQPAHGQVVGNGNGTFAYTPNANFNGTDTFTYDVTDDGATGGSADPKGSTGTVTINVSPVDDPPVANEDGYSTARNAALSVAAPGLLANDTDIEGDVLTAAKVAGPTHGTVTVDANGSFTYTPAAGFAGADSFTYKANDGVADSNVATVAIAVTNAAPVAADDSYAAQKNLSRTIAAPGLLANDSDANADALTAVKVGDPSHGAVTVNANGSFTYTPAAGFVGDDSFTYKANDGAADSNAATVAIRVANQAPVARDDTYQALKNVSRTVAAPGGLLANDADVNGDPLTAVKVTDPAHGAVTVNANGSFTYTPAAGFVGTDSFTYKANDGAADSNIATAAITVQNAPPVARDDSYQALKNVPRTIAAPAGLLANDTDVNGDQLTAVKVTDPAHGAVTVNVNGSFTYTPAAGFVGTDSFTYKANDGAADSNAATVSITVQNAPPVARDDSYQAQKNVPRTIAAPGLLGNDTDANGDLLSAVKVTDPAHGAVTVSATGSFTYAPAAGFVGTDSFTYKANDGTADSNAATVSISVGNTAPSAANDSYTAQKNVPLAIAVPGVLGNDNDANGDSLSAVKVTDPAHGVVTVNGNGSFTYTPASGFVGADSFTYKANDGAADSNAARVSITVQNTAPVARDDSYQAQKNVPRTIAAPGLLGNDTDLNGDPVTAVKVNDPAHGAVTVNADGSFTYTPAAGFVGGDSFTYMANDGAADSNVATVSISVGNTTPVATNDSYTAQKNVALTIGAPAVLGNDADTNGDPLTAIKVTDPVHGAVTLNANGSFTYTPASSFVGGDSFTYKANDGAADSSAATVSITVQNTAPLARDDSYALNEDNTLTISAPAGVLANDTDPNADPLTAVKVTGPAHGTLALNASGSFVYTPSPNFNGSDSFSYKANDGAADSSAATVAVNVRPVNDAPVATNGAATASEDTASTIDLRPFASDTETAKADLVYTIVSGPTHGAVNSSGLPNGSFSYTPSPNYFGTDSFTYSVTDRGDPDNCSGGPPGCAAPLTSAVKTLTITVNPVNDKPLAADGATRTKEETPVVFDVKPLVSDRETSKPSLTYNLEVAPVNGSVTNNRDGTFTYTPSADYNGSDRFTYSVTDRGDPDNCSGAPPACAGPLTSDAKTVSITVEPVNDAPSATDGTANANEDTPSTIDLRPFASDTETAKANLVYTIVSGPRNGSLTATDANGIFTYTPTTVPNTGDTFTYSVTDRGDPDNCGSVRAGCEGPLGTGVRTITLTIPSYVLSVARTGTGTGSVTSSPAGINCGLDCSEPYGAGKLVTLTAAPASDSTLAGWSGACAGASATCVVTMSSAKDVTADFAKKAYRLRVGKSGDGSGAVTSNPAGIDCGGTCDAVFDDGATVTLTAAAAANATFEGWSGACSGSGTSCTVAMSGAADVTAQFKAKKAPPPGPPVAGQSVVLGPVSGTVYYRKPGSNASSKLIDAVKVPTGTVVDAEEGVVNVKAADGNGQTENANFWAGVFRVDQYAFRADRLVKGTATPAKKTRVTQLTLMAGRFGSCAATRSQAGGSAAKKPPRKLWGSGKGKFRIKGRYSSATVLGAKWYVEDDCTGTRTRVARSVVEVRDFVKKKTVLLRAGHSYFAAAAKPKKR